ncbi:MAG: ABC transporter substrate-binding protein [Nakamurella sp.]
MNKWTAVVAMMATVAMVAAACGSNTGDSDGSKTSSGEQPSTTAGVAPTTSDSASAPQSSAETSKTETAPASAPSGDPMKFGYVLPETGDLAFLGPPLIEAVKYAVSLINEAGGVNGQQLAPLVSGDEANDAALAVQAATMEINKHVDAIIGAAATGMTMAIIDKITSSGVAECSGGNTGVILTDYPGKFGPSGQQLYFRAAASDQLQAPVLGNMVIADGHSKVAIVYRADDYGKGLARATADVITAGGGTVVLSEGFDPKTTDFAAIVQKVKSTNPDAVVTIAFEEGFQLWSQLFDVGLTPNKIGLYATEGMRSEDAPKKNFSDPSIVDGAKGTAPASAENPEFVKSLMAFAPKLDGTQFSAQFFDCVNIFALAAEQAKSNRTADWAKNVIGVTKGGTECKSFADCKKLIDAGEDIHYIGAAGDLSFTDHGEPGKATVEIFGYKDGGKLVSLGTKQSVLQ